MYSCCIVGGDADANASYGEKRVIGVVPPSLEAPSRE
jgi:hypothetical protein